jgi:hypothetical protein
MTIECYDTLVPVGKEAGITARLFSRSLFELGFRLRGRIIRFAVDGESIGEATTTPDGFATITYTPVEEKEYAVVATHVGSDESDPLTARATLFSRSTGKESIILDLDRTLWDTSTLGSLLRTTRNIPPLKDAVEVTRALSQNYDLLLITGRKSFFRRKPKRWLEEKGFPRMPLYFAPPTLLPLSHEEFKTDLIRSLKQTWENITVGIGDKDSDARAYLAAGLKAFIIRQKGECPPGAIMVPNWQTIRSILLG